MISARASSNTTMRAVFCMQALQKGKIEQLVETGFNTLVVPSGAFSEAMLTNCQSLGLSVYVEIGLFAGQKYWKQFPDSRPIGKAEDTLDAINWYYGVCPNHPELRRTKLDEIRKLLRLQEISGVFLDFIRYPCHWEAVRSASISEYCFCANCLNTFKKAGGITPEGEVWIAWKCQQITNFVKEVNELVMKINPSLKLGVFTVPWRQDDFEGAIRRIIGQDRLELTPFIDLFAPMTYHKLTANDPEWIVKVNRDIHLQTGRPVLPVVQVMDEPSRLNPEEFEKVLTLTLDYTHDLMVFHADALLEDAEKIEVIRNILGA